MAAAAQRVVGLGAGDGSQEAVRLELRRGTGARGHCTWALLGLLSVELVNSWTVAGRPWVSLLVRKIYRGQ